MALARLDDLAAWNDQLDALVQAGVPIDMGFRVRKDEIKETLRRIQDVVARRVGQDGSIDDALASEHDEVPSVYRSIMRLGLRSGDVAAAVAADSRMAASVERMRGVSRSSLLYPMIVCGLVYFGLIGMSFVLAPVVESIYGDLGTDVETGPLGLRIAHSVRATRPYWAPVPPLLFVIWAGSRLRRARYADRPSADFEGTPWIPGRSRTIALERWANLAEAMAALLERGDSLEESFRLASGAWGGASGPADLQAIADTMRHGAMPDDAPAVANRLPPFLSWAIWHAEPTPGRIGALRMASEIYAIAARRNTERLRTAAPMIACAVVGGAATGLYALAIFLPVAELIKHLASTMPG